MKPNSGTRLRIARGIWPDRSKLCGHFREEYRRSRFYGYPDDHDNTYAGKVMALRTGDLNDAAKSILHPDNLVWVVVGDRAKIEAGLRELNIGEAKIIDADGNAK